MCDRTTTDDRVVLVLARRRVTLRTALLQADDFFESEIPATWPLAKIAADRAEVTDLRRRDRVCRFRESGKTLAHTGVFFELSQRNERADSEPATIQRDLIEPTDPLQIDQPGRTRRVVFHGGQQILPAGNRSWRLIDVARRSNSEHLHGFVDRRRISPLECFHVRILLLISGADRTRVH